MKNSRKILFSIIALVVAVVAASTSTYAWFTTNTTVTVDTFSMDVKSNSDTLLVAVTASDAEQPAITSFKYTLTTADINAVINESPSTDLDAVTSADGKSFKKIDNTAAADTASYVALKFWFATTNIATNGKIQVSSLTLNQINGGNIEGTQSAVAGTYNAQDVVVGGNLDTQVLNAVRLSFYNGTDAYVYGEDTAAGYGNCLTTGNLAVDQYNAVVDPGTDIVCPAEQAALTVNVPSTKLTVATFGDTASSGYYYTSATLYIWVEGYDADCLNDILDDVFSVSIGFTQVNA